MRGVGLTWIPGGVGFALLGVTLALAHSGDELSPLAMLAGALAFASNIVVSLIAWTQPEWSKPGWLRERDRTKPPRSSQEGGHDLMYVVIGVSVIGTLACVYAAIAAM